MSCYGVIRVTVYVRERIVRIILRHRDVRHLVASAVGFMIRRTQEVEVGKGTMDFK